MYFEAGWVLLYARFPDTLSTGEGFSVLMCELDHVSTSNICDLFATKSGNNSLQFYGKFLLYFIVVLPRVASPRIFFFQVHDRKMFIKQ